MRWPWQTKEDVLLHMLDAVMADNRAARDEHDRALGELKEEGDDG